MSDTSRPRFAFSLFPQYDYLNECQVLGIVNPILPALSCVVMDSWQALLNLRSDNPEFAGWDEGDCAALVTRFAYTRAVRTFTDCRNIQLLFRYRKLAIEIDEKLAVIVKKLTPRRKRWSDKPRLTRSHYLTPRSAKLYLQAQAPDDDLPQMPRVVLGYVFEKEITEIRLVLAYPRSTTRGFEWIHPVTPQGQIGLGVFSPGPDEDDGDDKGYTVEPVTPDEGTGTGKEPDGR